MNDRTLGPSDPDYPPSLRELGQPPDPLYVRGTLSGSRLLVGIVGTRNASPAGHAFAERLASDLARLGIGIISGGARGVDGAAHDGALSAGGHTTVVVATGYDVAYPREHESLFARIVASDGCVLSERPPGSQPIPTAFPARNRIVAALAACIVVVEAPARSGALSTARAATKLGRTVLAVPGRPDDPRVAGCIGLLRNGAVVCAGARDVLDVLARPSAQTSVNQTALDLPTAPRSKARDSRRAKSSSAATPAVSPFGERGPAVGSTLTPTLSPFGERGPAVGSALTGDDERRVLALLGGRGCDFDALCARSGLGAGRVRAALSMLGLAGLVVEKPGDAFARTGRGASR